MTENISNLLSMLIYIIIYLTLGILAFSPLPWLGKGLFNALVKIDIKSILLEFEQRKLRAFLILCLTFTIVLLIPLVINMSYFPNFTGLIIGIGLLKTFTVIFYPVIYKLPNSNEIVIIKYKNIDKILSQYKNDSI